MPTKKMSLQQFKSLFSSERSPAFKPERATQKKFKHVVNPAFKPFKAELTPRQWMLKQRSKKKGNK